MPDDPEQQEAEELEETDEEADVEGFVDLGLSAKSFTPIRGGGTGTTRPGGSATNQPVKGTDGIKPAGSPRPQ